MKIEVLSIKPIGQRVKNYLKQQGETIVSKDPDFRVVAYYDKILTKDQLRVPTINLHPGYLPYNRGVHTHIWPLIDGTPAGITIHYMNEQVDKGEIIAQKRIKVYPTDIASDLEERINEEMFKLFIDVWPKIKIGKIESKPQAGKGTYHWKKEITSFQEFDKKTIDRLRACTFKDRSYGYFIDKGNKYYVGVKFFKQADIDNYNKKGVGKRYKKAAH